MIDWLDWFYEPYALYSIIGLGWIYTLLIGPLRTRFAGPWKYPKKEAVFFYSGWVLLFLVIASPVSRIGTLYLFSVHVCIHMTIVFPIASLILLGLPSWLIDAFLKLPGIKIIAKILSYPWVCGMLFVLLISLWYVPRASQWGLSSPLNHCLEYTIVLSSGMIMAWPLLSRSQLYPKFSYATRMVYLFGLEVAMTAVFSYLLMAEHPIYSNYIIAPRLITGFDVLSDQSFGAILLSGISSLFFVGALGASFYQWSKKSA
jgi:putative membrane protein